MHYPFWLVPGLTSPMLIAAVAVLHVFVSLYAVGGGIFLAVEVTRAYRAGDRDYLDYLKSHAKFFVLVTMIWGSITGVGIWWTIGLASPLATEFLIRTFVFAWAMEYVFFLIEIVSAFVFWYGWGRLDPRRHLAALWVYAAAAWISLLIITPITAFMLNPGDWRGEFWRGLANPQALPQVAARTGAALLLATLYVYLHASLAAGEAVRALVVRRTGRLALAGAVLFVLGAGGWFAALPASARAAAIGSPVLNIFGAVVAGCVSGVFLMVFVGLRREPKWLSPGFALLLWGMGLAAVGAGEFIREAIRKPYVVCGEVYSHGVLPGEIEGLRRKGFIAGSSWARRGVYRADTDKRTPRVIRDLRASRARGRALLFHHCGSCHSETGYMGLDQLLRGWSGGVISQLVRHPESFRFVMPPWSGTPAEAATLAEYLWGVVAEPSPAAAAGFESRAGVGGDRETFTPAAEGSRGR